MQPPYESFAAALLVLLVLVIVLINAPGVKAAIQRWFGYVPGSAWSAGRGPCAG
jgi:hypothetical protein